MLASGEVLFTGGLDARSDQSTAHAELYSPGTGLFTATGDLPYPEMLHTATLFEQRSGADFGGVVRRVRPSPQRPRSSLIPRPEPSRPAGDPTDTRLAATATLLLDGEVLIAGGEVLTIQLANGISTNAAQLYP